jgi:hypothetical protein
MARGDARVAVLGQRRPNHGVALFMRDLIFKHGLSRSLRARARQRL